MLDTQTDLDYLIPELRLYMSDYSTPYTYTDELLRMCLVNALKALGRLWHNRYFIAYDAATDTYVTTRNGDIATFIQNEPPVVETADEAVIILQAAIVLKSAVMYDSTWDIASWKDDEVSYSNLQGGKLRNDSLLRDQELLKELLKSRLHPGKVQAMPGFHLPYNTKEGTM